MIFEVILSFIAFLIMLFIINDLEEYVELTKLRLGDDLND